MANTPRRPILPACFITLFAALAIALGLCSNPAPSALQQLTQLRREAHAARQSGNTREYVSLVLKIEALLNDSPDAVENLAAAYAIAGDAQHALAALSRFADLGQADDELLAGKDQYFSMLHDSPEYKSILHRFVQNKTPISRAAAALTLSDPGILSEDIDFDPQSKSFLITSVLEKKIIRATPQGAIADFAASPSHWPMLALKIDSRRSLVWATEVALDDFNAAPHSDWGRSAVLCFDLKSGTLLDRVEGPPHSALGDMVLAPNGDPIVSDGASGVVYRFTGGRLKPLNARDFISPQTSAVLPDGIHVLVPDYDRGIANLNLTSGAVTWLERGDQTKPVALNGIDGLYFYRGSLLLTQNGTSPERVVRLQLDPTRTKVVSEEIIERATPTLGDPTHGVVVGDSFFYIANSGWSALDDHGNLKPGSKLTSARVMRFELR